jgi:ABC-type Na+ transport system ATPase subunit NatA
MRLADSVVVLDAGEVVKTGVREDLSDENVRRLLVV